MIKKNKRLSAVLGCEGSATVEAALAIPVFLMAVCALFFIGQLLLVEGEIHFSLAQAARVCADQEALKEEKISERDVGKNGNTPGEQGMGLSPQSVFMSIFDGSSLCNASIAGGSGAVLVQGKKDSSSETVRLTARYILKVPVFLFRTILFPRKISLEERIFSGYMPHAGDEGEGTKDCIVYVTERGTVYHRRADCTHICLRIINEEGIRTIMFHSRFRPCEKCIHGTSGISSLYITAEGDCYHSSLSCSGLKRSVRAVYLSEIPGMRPCSRCAAGR